MIRAPEHQSWANAAALPMATIIVWALVLGWSPGLTLVAAALSLYAFDRLRW